MSRILDKCIIFFAATIIYIEIASVNIYTILALLLTIIFSCANTCIDLTSEFSVSNSINTKMVVLTILFCIYALLSLIIPYMFLFLPLIFYDNCRYHLRLSGSISIICICIGFGTVKPPVIYPLAGLFLLSLTILLELKTSRVEQLSDNLKQLRDTTTEHKLLLEENQKMLQSQQDAMVYMATLKERNRIAREIHDNVGHLLTRSILMVGAIKTIQKDSALEKPLDTLQDSLNTAMTSIRSSVHDLHDDAIDLKTAINDIIQPIDKFEISLDYDVGKNVDKDIKYCFIAIIKEGVNNAVKHSNGNHMDIIVREHPGLYQLQLEDNGTNIATAQRSGIGLTNIRERVDSLNGTLKISTDSGFRIFISVLKQK